MIFKDFLYKNKLLHSKETNNKKSDYFNIKFCYLKTDIMIS